MGISWETPNWLLDDVVRGATANPDGLGFPTDLRVPGALEAACNARASVAQGATAGARGDREG